jgi:hypothetical protein
LLWWAAGAQLTRAQDSGHGRDVESEQGAADGGEATDGVDVVEGLRKAVC